jgi:single-strand DNA-binding protein
MSNFLSVVAVGNVGDAPDFKYTQSGKPVATFRLAVNVKKDVTRWIRVTAWEQLAETVNQYVHKGDLVLIRCNDLESHAYLGGGIPKASTELTAREIVFLGNRQGAPQSEPDEIDALGKIPF